MLNFRPAAIVPVQRRTIYAVCAMIALLIASNVYTFGYISAVKQCPIAPTERTSLPPPPVQPTLSITDKHRLEEPWKWFETSGEHKDLLAKVVELRERLGRPVVILDIGLNIGSAPWAIEKLCPDCIIYGFEPIPKYFAFAQYKLPVDRYPNVHLYNYAICDHVGSDTIWMDTETNVGWNTLIAEERSRSQVAVPISCVTIDNLVETHTIGHNQFDLIKIDVEGAEHMVIRGMKNTIAQHTTPKPLLYIEVGWGVKRKDWADELSAFQFLFDNGYEKYDLSRIGGTSMHWITPTRQ